MLQLPSVTDTAVEKFKRHTQKFFSAFFQNDSMLIQMPPKQKANTFTYLMSTLSVIIE